MYYFVLCAIELVKLSPGLQRVSEELSEKNLARGKCLHL